MEIVPSPPQLFFQNRLCHNIALRQICSFLSREDLRSFSLVAWRYTPFARAILFQTCTLTIRHDDDYMTKSIEMLANAGHNLGPGAYIQVLHLRGHFDLSLPPLTMPTVVSLLSVMPIIYSIQITGFTWMGGVALVQPTVFRLREIYLTGMMVGTPAETPLHLLGLVPKWNRVHVFDIEHTVEPTFEAGTSYRCDTLYFQHDSWADPARSLPELSSRFTGMQNLVASQVDVTHFNSLPRLINGCYLSLCTLIIRMNSVQHCTYLGSHFACHYAELLL